MTIVPAFALHAISARIAGVKTMIPASTKTDPSVFATTKEKLDELIKLGAARLATEDEVAIAERRGKIIDMTVPAPSAAVATVADERPATGAEGDPQGNKKAAAAAKAAEAEKPAEPATAAEPAKPADPAAAVSDI